MRAEGLQVRRQRRFRVTTDSAHRLTVVANHLRRRFTVDAPDRAWVADITYLDTAEGWLYLAVVIDLYARRVVGWAVQETLATELACAALHLALGRLRPLPGSFITRIAGSSTPAGRIKRCSRRTARGAA